LPVGGKNRALNPETARNPAVLVPVNTIATFLDHWFDPASLGIVLGGTLLATVLRCGLAETRLALAKIAALAARPFDPDRARAQMARQIRGIAKEGFVRAEPVQFGDGEFDHLADVLISRRSIEALLGEHQEQKRTRVEAAQTAVHVLGQAAELAPVLGLAGTLVALGTMTPDGTAGGMTGAIAMAVVTTLYGIAAANFLFSPLAAAIERRSAREERDRQAALDWLENGVRTAASRPLADPPVGRRILREVV
jgi:chemotaxis protein MotA|tara:strand:- start:168 stop:923 length:756 start_codon:yes stop_codon:yes gene_type:complete